MISDLSAQYCGIDAIENTKKWTKTGLPQSVYIYMEEKHSRIYNISDSDRVQRKRIKHGVREIEIAMLTSEVGRNVLKSPEPSKKLGMVVHAYNPRASKIESGNRSVEAS